MAFNNRQRRVAFIVLLVLLIIGLQGQLPKKAVADVEGQACTTNKDCPCWGELVSGEEAFGIGTATCDEGTKTCDTSFCIDVQPVGQYLKDEPLQVIKDNIVLTIAIVGLILLTIAWPAQ